MSVRFEVLSVRLEVQGEVELKSTTFKRASCAAESPELDFSQEMFSVQPVLAAFYSDLLTTLGTCSLELLRSAFFFPARDVSNYEQITTCLVCSGFYAMC